MKRMVFPLVFLVFLGFVACGDGGGDGGPMSVALFINDAYINYTDDPMDDTGYEGYNVLFHLQTEALSYTAFSGISATDFSAALAGRDALIIPEQEEGELMPDLSPDAQAVIGNFVDDGGTLICMWTDAYALTIVNTIFGYSMEEGGLVEPVTYNAADADGTRFGGGPASLIKANATTSVSGTTLPTGAKSMYLDSVGDSVVTWIREGSGQIILLGYDWYDAAPFGIQDGGWVEVLNRALRNN